MTLEELVGSRIQRARKAHRPEWSQADLGLFMGRFLGEEGWTAKVISHAEQGRRKFAVADLVAFAAVLGRPLAWFLLPDDAHSEIALGRRERFGARQLIEAVTGQRFMSEEEKEAFAQEYPALAEDEDEEIGRQKLLLTELANLRFALRDAVERTGALEREIASEEQVLRAARYLAATLSEELEGGLAWLRDAGKRVPETPSPRAREAFTEREQQVLMAVAEGFSNSEIAGRLKMSESEVRDHMKRILSKLGPDLSAGEAAEARQGKGEQ
jgi:DNA-binding CsgD family transcriptional regulator